MVMIVLGIAATVPLVARIAYVQQRERAHASVRERRTGRK